LPLALAPAGCSAPSTSEEREWTARLLCDVYVGGQRDEHPGADHEPKMA
jgi:hypothetical protein